MKRYLILFLFLSVCFMNIGIAKADTNSDFDIQDGVLVKYNGEGGAVVIPEGVTSIGEKAFYGCSTLTSIIIPESVTCIGESAFEDCSNLTSASLPSGITDIEAFTFEGCNNLSSITIPDGVTSIKNNAFSGCGSLKGVVIPANVTTIEDFAFDYCCNLTDITIPAKVSRIGKGAFWECDGLTSVTISEGVTSIADYAFYDCSNLTSITVPNGVEEIGYYAFGFCRLLTTVSLPGSVTSIDETAFPIDGVTFFVDRNSYAETELKKLGAVIAYNYPPDSVNLMGYSVSISEKINLQFYYDIAEGDVVGGDLFAKVYCPDGSIKRVYFDADKKLEQDGTTYYAIECELAAKEMNDKVAVQLWNTKTKNTCSKKSEYSVKEYLDDLLAFSSDSATEENLVNAMLTYGAYSQAYFQYNTENLATELLSNYLTENVSSVNAYLNTLASDEFVGELPDGISLYGSSLILESTIGYRLYFQADNSDTAKTYGLTYDAKEGYYYTELFSLSPLELNDLFEFKLGDATIRSCPLRYVTYALGENRSDELKQLCVAIVNYHRAAEEYATYLENCSRNGTEILN